MLATAADILTDAWHNVTVLMPVFDPELQKRDSLKSTKNKIFVEPSEKVEKLMDGMTGFLENLWIADNENPLSMLSVKGDSMTELFSAQCRKVMLEPGLIENLKAENYDLAITEPFDLCAHALFEAINIRAHVAILSASRFDHATDIIGQPVAASYVPGTQSHFGERMTTWERFGNYIHYYCSSYNFKNIGDSDFEAAKSVMPIKRSWREALPEASFIFTNQIPLLDFPSPTFDKIVPIGGLSVKTDKHHLKLDKKWSEILDKRKKNVLISFGSNVKSMDMPEKFKKSLLEVFESMLDTTFIWKYENPEDNIVDHLENVYLGNWLPQNELLADSRLTLFVTHGGLGSVTELAMMGKPAVLIPLFADQGRNGQMLKRHGGALVLNKNDLSNPRIVQKTLEDVMKNPSYRKNAESLAEMLNNQPTNPKETLVKYVELAARSKTLKKSPSLTLFYVRFFIDAFLSIGNLIMLVIAYIQLSKFRYIVDNTSTYIFFFAAYPLVELMSIRGFLVIIITLDRTFAVFFPVSYHNYRIKIPNIAVIILVFSYSGWENLVFWIICKYKVNIPPGCITFDCINNMCYLTYFLGYEMIVHALIALLSLLLVIKIFIWNRFSNPSENKDLTRANRLALIDAFIIFAFDVTPAVAMANFENVKFEDVGPIFSFTKMGGYALEGFLVFRALKRKNEMELENNKSLSLVQVKPSGV